MHDSTVDFVGVAGIVVFVFAFFLSTTALMRWQMTAIAAMSNFNAAVVTLARLS